MNRLLSLVLVIFLALTLAGCKIIDLPLLNKDTPTATEDEELKYKIDKVILSKGYQSLEQKVEVIKKNNEVSLIVSVGLLESSGVEVEQIVKIGNVINIHIVNESDEENLQLVVPQIILDLKNAKSINMDEIKFNLINENFKPIEVKFGLNEVINKIVNDYKLTANSSPNISLSKDEDKLIWNMNYASIFDSNNLETPLVNLSVQVDANSGDVLESKKGLISSYIDHGHIMDYAAERYILYKKTFKESEEAEIESLWYFDIKNNKKTQVYQTHKDIVSAEFSPNTKNIGVLEDNGTAKEIYLVSRDEKKAFKPLFKDNLIPALARWYSNDKLYILQSDEKLSKIYSYDLLSSKEELVSTIDKNITDMRIYDRHFLLMEPIENSSNKSIFHTRDFKALTLIDNGFMPRYINKNLLAYLKNSEENDRNSLIIYDMKHHKEYDQVDADSLSISSIPGDKLLVVEKNQSVNDFAIYEYSTKNKDLNFITKINSDNIYLDKKKNFLYVDLMVPFEANKSEIIFSVDITKLSKILP
ncbi:hypothetical protein E9840_03860 [Tissierella creatinini]|nr:hypothetical protein E9840_03860 [Tissierella creatinini]TJX67395.1 hypothetical protein E8P77_05440 [Soehngenia saccharolytica]